MKQRLDKALLVKELVSSRSQAEDFIKRGFVTINGLAITKPGYLVSENDMIVLRHHMFFVSRAGEKLYSVIPQLHLRFSNLIVLDVGSSTGGFTDVALRHHAKKVIAVEKGTMQFHQSLRGNPKIELHENTDIRNFSTPDHIDVVLIDVSFISLREVLPSISLLVDDKTDIVAMVKPQFEAEKSNVKHKGVIKNDRIRREILHDFEQWALKHFIIVTKADSKVAGAKGNLERFYVLRKLPLK